MIVDKPDNPTPTNVLYCFTPDELPDAYANFRQRSCHEAWVTYPILSTLIIPKLIRRCRQRSVQGNNVGVAMVRGHEKKPYWGFSKPSHSGGHQRDLIAPSVHLGLVFEMTLIYNILNVIKYIRELLMGQKDSEPQWETQVSILRLSCIIDDRSANSLLGFTKLNLFPRKTYWAVSLSRKTATISK